MFPLDLFTEQSRTFWNVRSPIKDIDETDASMSSDDASEADLLDSEANSDIGRRASDINMSFAHATLDAELEGFPRHRNRRRERSLACYSAYSLPSRKERQAFKRHFRRKKGMFIEEPHLPIVHALVNPVEILISNQFASQCHVVDNEHIPVDSVLTSASIPYDEHRSTEGSVSRVGGTALGYFDLQPTANRLKIKIPGLIDRLALRLLRSCNVTGQAEEDEDVDALASPDSYSASESSSSDGDIDDDDDDYDRSSCSSSAPHPDRSSRRKLRRCAASPYSRMEGKPKRKELWAEVDTSAGSKVPASLLASPTTDRPRVLRSGRHW